MNTEKLKEYAPAVARIGLSLVFLWFGINQLINPALFEGYVPAFLGTIAHAVVLGNGIAEVILGLLLFAGLFTRIVALLLAIHLAAITISLGFGEIAVRDFGLFCATLAVALWGEDTFSLRQLMKKKS